MFSFHPPADLIFFVLGQPRGTVGIRPDAGLYSIVVEEEGKIKDVLFYSILVGMEPPQLSVSEERHLAILTELPFVVPFEERVKVLHISALHIAPCTCYKTQTLEE